VKFGFGTPFEEQLDFFRQKLNLPTERWDDITLAAHDRAFIVAGAMKADLLADLRGAVDKAIEQGTGLEAFRKDFKAIVAKHGWTGWTGEGTAAGEAWRTKVIYQTNMATSYAAGRYRQLTDPEFLKIRPYWRYKHADWVQNPRMQHVAWNNLTLPHDHEFWKTHFPPNGWGCHCRVTPVDVSEYEKSKAAGQANPPEGWDAIDHRTGAPVGIAKGFDYAPGESVAPILRPSGDKMESQQYAVARNYCNALRESSVFARFVNGKLPGEFPVAVLDESTRAALGSEARVVLLSQETALTHLDKHPEVSVNDYRKIQDMLDQGEIYRHGDERLVYLWSGEKLYRAAIKRTQDSQRNYFLTLFMTSEDKATKEIRGRLERIR
jgi:hypothetical protein